MPNVRVATLQDISEMILVNEYQAVVVEGYDGVGKGTVISTLKDCSRSYSVYRPDYNFWEKYKLPKSHRWAINAAYLDILKQTSNQSKHKVIIFDRGMLSGIVYNSPELSEGYKYLLKGLKVFHIIVRCDRESYYDFKEVRGVDDGNTYDTCQIKTLDYINTAHELGLDYIVYTNKYDEDLGNLNKLICGGCGHYNQGKCMNPHVSNVEVGYHRARCEYSKEREVQDEQL